MRAAAFSLILLAACSPSPGVLTAAPELGGSVKNSLGMKLVYIPPGKFMMGSPESEPGREAQEVQHEVELTKGFYLGMHEVTVGQFKAFANNTKYVTDGERDGKGAYGINEAGKIEEMHAKFTWKSPGFEQTDDHPVVDVSWNDAKAFCLNFRAYYHPPGWSGMVEPRTSKPGPTTTTPNSRMSRRHSTRPARVSRPPWTNSTRSSGSEWCFWCRSVTPR